MLNYLRISCENLRPINLKLETGENLEKE